MLNLENTLVGGDFRVVRPLAMGGMGGVYLAIQESTGQQRALKVMHPTLVQDPRLRERFEQEARVGAQVPSHHVVQVIAAGVDRELGVPWIAMELLSGEDLGACMRRRGAIPLGEVVPIFRQLCHALSAAHSVGIVHRDVKPENIYLASIQSADTHWQVKVLDFGIAKLMADAAQSSTAQIGTPLWMAPEQSDAARAISPAADVWSLGLMAYRLLTGLFYWQSANQENAPLSALFRELLVDPLVPASERATAQGVSALLPPGFDLWFARAVVRDPEQRFQSVREAFTAFEALAGMPQTLYTPLPIDAPTRHASAPAITATPIHTQPTPSKSSSKVWILVLLALAVPAVLVVVLVAFGAGAYMFRSEVASKESAEVGASKTEPGAVPAGPGATPTDPQAQPDPTSKKPNTTGSKVTAPGTPTPADPKAAAADAGPTLKPIDKAAVEAKVKAAAASAQSDCAKLKSPDAGVETYTGTVGFRPDGTRSSGMQGGGGAQMCVRERMFGLTIGKYEHPQAWHVEVFPWSVTIK